MHTSIPVRTVTYMGLWCIIPLHDNYLLLVFFGLVDVGEVQEGVGLRFLDFPGEVGYEAGDLYRLLVSLLVDKQKDFQRISMEYLFDLIRLGVYQSHEAYLLGCHDVGVDKVMLSSRREQWRGERSFVET